MVHSGNITNSVVTVVSDVPEIDKQQITGIKLGDSGKHGNLDIVRRFDVTIPHG